MKQTTTFLVFLIAAVVTFGQDSTNQYSYFSKKADSLYIAKDYKQSAYNYSRAFESLGWKGSQVHRYNAACAWALAGNADSAFFQLFNIATKQLYSNYVHLTTDPALISLHSQQQWESLLDLVKQNKERADKAEAKLNKPLVAQLDSIFKEDQKLFTRKFHHVWNTS